MKRSSISGIVFLLTTGIAGFAQDDADLSKWMKATSSELGAIRKAESKTGADVASSAEKLAVLFDQGKGYWEKKQVSDAVKMSEDGKAASLELATAAKAGDADKANAAFRTVGGTCKSCHDLHREKLADGSYKIK